MSWRRAWVIKCDGVDCPVGMVTDTPADTPEGWASDGVHHLCPECVEKQQTPTEPVVVGSNSSEPSSVGPSE